jgi:threonine 3-dehydrogenase
MAEKKIVVIGGAGAIGKYLLPQLIQIYGPNSVIAALRSTPLPPDVAQNVICEYGFDIRNEDAIRSLFTKYSNSIISVWNLAAPLSVDTANDPQSAYDITVGGMDKLLKCMKEFEIKTIYFSDSIGSFGETSPRENCYANWLSENPNQDPGSDYGRQKRLCRDLLHFYSLNHGFDSRFVIIPGVLHLEPYWAGGTTEYALDAIQAALERKEYISPVDLNTSLPMIHVSDLVKGMIALMLAPADKFTDRASCRGVCLAGFSFTPNELFAVIRQYYPDFSASYSAEISPNVTKFSLMWPNSLDPNEAKEFLNFESVISFEETIRQIIQAHQQRRREISLE